MDKLREAAALALEALLDGNALFDLEGSSESYKLAITALREALAQPITKEITVFEGYISSAQTEALRKALAQPQGEWVDLTDDEIQLNWSNTWTTDCQPWAIEFARSAISNFKQKNSRPAITDKPVAWMDNDGNVCDHNEFGCFNIPLYTTPPVAPQGAPYGRCPICGAKGRIRERRIDGNDTCDNGHSYKSSLAVKAQPQVSDYDREFWGDGQDHSEQHLNMVQGSWVDLTDDEIVDFCMSVNTDGSYVNLEHIKVIIAKFKEKNTLFRLQQQSETIVRDLRSEQPLVAPQVVTEGNASEVRSTDTGEPVAWMYKFKTEDPILCKVKRDWADNHSQWKETPLYTTPPSSQRADVLVKAAYNKGYDEAVEFIEATNYLEANIKSAVEAAMEETKEKAAKVCMKQQYDLRTRQTFAAAIRSMK